MQQVSSVHYRPIIAPSEIQILGLFPVLSIATSFFLIFAIMLQVFFILAKNL